MHVHHMTTDVCRGQKRVLVESPELELQAFVSCPIQVMGTESGFSERVASSLYCTASSPGLKITTITTAIIIRGK